MSKFEIAAEIARLEDRMNSEGVTNALKSAHRKLYRAYLKAAA